MVATIQVYFVLQHGRGLDEILSEQDTATLVSARHDFSGWAGPLVTHAISAALYVITSAGIAAFPSILQFAIFYLFCNPSSSPAL